MKQQELRCWIEKLLAVFSAFLFLLTLIWRDWIEAIFRIDPDAHSGALEWLISAALAGLTVFLAIRARMDWRAKTEGRRVPATPTAG